MFYEWLRKALDLKVATSIWNFLYYKISQPLIVLLFFLGRSQISLIKAMGIGIIFIVKVTYWWLVFSNTVHSWYMYRLIRTHLATSVVFCNNCCICYKMNFDNHNDIQKLETKSINTVKNGIKSWINKQIKAKCYKKSHINIAFTDHNGVQLRNWILSIQRHIWL